MTTQRAYVDWHPIVGLNDLPPEDHDILITIEGGAVMATCGMWDNDAWLDYEIGERWKPIAWAYKPAAYRHELDAVIDEDAITKDTEQSPGWRVPQERLTGDIETVIEVPAVVTMSASTYAHMQDAGCAPTKVKVRME